MLAIRPWSDELPIVSRWQTKPYNCQKYKKLALKLWIQTYQILKNDDEVCIPSLSSILLAVLYNYVCTTMYVLLYSML